MARDASVPLPSGKVDYLERISRLFVLGFFALAILAILVAPLLAIAWQQRPFLGFLIDQTLVVNGNAGRLWGTEYTGIEYPEHLLRVAGRPVETPSDFYLAIAHLLPGDKVQVFTENLDGTESLYPAVRVQEFPISDFMRMFWLPYLIGIAYLGIGIWIYRLRGATRPGRALAFFCVVISIVTTCLFDVSTTHVLTLIWTIALAQVGAALISLAWRFPEEWFPVQFHPYLLALPYSISIVLSLWAISTLYDIGRPWAYVPMWEACQRYAGFGSIFFLAVIVYRCFTGRTVTIRRQARLMVIGSILAFIPVTVWFIAPLFGVDIAFDPMLFLPTLIIFPLSVALAILRYRLWEVDDFVNYAFVYGASTAILAGVFAALTGFTQRLFVATTGAKSDTAIIIATLIIATAFTPLKDRVQKFFDRHLRESSYNTVKLRAFGEQSQAFAQMHDVVLLCKRLLNESVAAFGSDSGIVSVYVAGKLRTIHVIGSWKDHAALSVPLECEGERYGLLQLGARHNDLPYVDSDGEALQQVAAQVALAMSIDWPRFIRSQEKMLEIPKNMARESNAEEIRELNP